MQQSAAFLNNGNELLIKNFKWAERTIVPSLEAKATNGHPVFTPRQWVERFRHFSQREHKIDIAPLIKGDV